MNPTQNNSLFFINLIKSIIVFIFKVSETKKIYYEKTNEPL